MLKHYIKILIKKHAHTDTRQSNMTYIIIKCVSIKRLRCISYHKSGIINIETVSILKLLILSVHRGILKRGRDERGDRSGWHAQGRGADK